MKTGEQKKAKKSVGQFFIKLAFLAFVIYSAISIIVTQVSLAEKRDELAAIQMRAEELAESNEEYQRLLSVEDDKEYMEKIAVEQLGYAYPNEQRFYVRN